MKLYFEHSPLFIILAAIIALAVAWLLYFYKKKSFQDISVWKKYLMASLRFLFVFIILLLLLKPLIKKTSVEIQKPIIVFAQDNTMSISLNKDSLYYKNDYKKDIQKLISDLKTDYDVRYLQFSDAINNDTVLNYKGELTDISAIFPEINARFSGMNLAAVVLATDGIYNKGINPVYSKNIKTPVYSIAIGDTISQKDLILKDIMHNKIAFYGNTFPVRIFISAEKVIEKEAEIIITRNGEKILNQKFEIPQNSSVKTIELELPADKLGIQQYEITLTYLPDEISYVNNHSDFIINVIDNRNKVLLLANSPHPDIGAIQSALKNNPDIELTIAYINDFKDNIRDYNLLVLHNLPSINNNIAGIVSEIEKNKISVLYILGTSTSLNVFNKLNTGFSISGIGNKTEDAVPALNSGFLAFSIEPNDKFFTRLSPLKVFFGDYSFGSEAKILLYQTISGVKTEKPLIAFNENQNVKNGYIFGEGLWKWRIDDYKYNSEHTYFNSIINRIIQYLIVKKIQDKLNVETKQIFNENEPVIINAEFYNETFEIVPNLDITLILTDNNEKEYKYNFDNIGNSYRLVLGRLSDGRYKYSSKTTFDNRDYTANGEFIVKKINTEAITTTANHRILYQLADLTKANVYYPQNMNNIKQDLDKNKNIVSVAYTKDRLYTISDLYYIFFIILLFTATEWGLRKYFGSY